MLHDFRFAVRRLAAAPLFSVVTILTLALGLGANAALGSIILAVIVRPLPLPESHRVIHVRAVNQTTPQVSSMSARDVEDWTRESRTIAAFAAWRDWSFRRSTPQGREGYYGIITTPGMFSVLGVRPLMGRVFTEQEDRPGQGEVILLTESAWRGRFGGDPQILGRTLLLSRAPRGERPFTIIGIMPDLEIPSLEDVAFYAPSSVDEDAQEGRWTRNRSVWARVRDDSSVARARSELTGLAARLATAYPDSHGGWTVDVRPLARTEIGSTRAALLFFAAAVAVVLLSACANVASLLIARAAGREREFALRVAVGAKPWHLVKLVAAEAAVLAGTAGAVALLLRVWLLDVIVSLGPAIPRMAPIPPAATLALTLALSLIAAGLFGLVPAWFVTRRGVAEVVKRDARTTTGSGLRARSWLVGVQVALAVVLISGAAVSLRVLARLLAAPPGYNPRGVVVSQLFPPPTKYPTRESVGQLAGQVLEAVRSIPGVESAGTVSSGPLFGGYEPVEVASEAVGAQPGGKYPTVRYFDASPGYFDAIGAPLRHGRDFTSRDVAGAPPVAIVNEAFAARFFPGQPAVGGRVRLVREGETLEVVGVVADSPKRANREAIEPEIYWPYLQRPRWAFYLVVRSAARPDTVVAALRMRIGAVGPDLVPPRFSTMSSLLARASRGDRFGALVLGLFAGSALLLAALGTYGLVSYSATQRTREIGIRISFGATPADIMRLVASTAMRPILCGAAVGVVVALAVRRFAAAALMAGEGPDTLAFAVAVAVLALAASIACLVPARRATRIDPAVALGTE